MQTINIILSQWHEAGFLVPFTIACGIVVLTIVLLIALSLLDKKEPVCHSCKLPNNKVLLDAHTCPYCTWRADYRGEMK